MVFDVAIGKVEWPTGRLSDGGSVNPSVDLLEPVRRGRAGVVTKIGRMFRTARGQFEGLLGIQMSSNIARSKVEPLSPGSTLWYW